MAQDAPFLEEVIPPVELGRFAPVDLGRVTWRVTALDGSAMARLDYDDSSWVARAAVTPELLRNPVAWYRLNFAPAPGTDGLGSLLELGGVEGNVAVYLNGRFLGEMKGAVEPPYQRTETFILPSGVLNPDRNVLALRLAGLAGRSMVGILKGPVRLHPLSTVYEQAAATATAQREADRLRVRRASGVATGSLPFGRFGGSHREGLLTATLWPEGFQSATTSFDPQPLQGSFGPPPTRALQVATLALSPYGKILRVELAGGERYLLYYPLQYPGFVIKPLNGPLVLEMNRPMNLLWIDAWGVATASFEKLPNLDSVKGESVAAPNAGKARIHWTEPWLLLYDQAGERPPILIASSQLRSKILMARRSAKLSLELPVGEMIRFCWPEGISPWTLRSDPQALARLRVWASAMVPFGIKASSYPSGGELSIENDTLTFEEEFRYLPVGAIPYAPLSPIFGLLLEAGHPKLRAPGAKYTGITTLAGPLWAVSHAHRSRLELPVGEPDAQVVPRTEGDRAHNSVDLPDSLGASALDLAYTRRASAFSKWLNLSRAARSTLEANGTAQLARAWAPNAWSDNFEPFTGAMYSWTAGHHAQGRIWGIGKPSGLAIFGTSLASMFTGDWRLPQSQWLTMKRAHSFLEIAFDWAWQAPSAAEDGISTGDTGHMAAAYLGAIGMQRLAAVVASPEEMRYKAVATRMHATLEALSHLSRYGRKNGLIAPGEFAVGLRETGLESSTSSPQIGEFRIHPELGEILRDKDATSTPILLAWAPARLDDAVFKPESRTLEVKLTMKKAVDRFIFKLRSARPTEILWNTAPAHDTRYDALRGELSIGLGKVAGPQTLLVRY